MHLLKAGGLPLPELYVCRTRLEAMQAMEAGLPFVKTGMPDDRIVRIILFRTVRRMFPKINWSKVLGVNETTTLSVTVPGGKPSIVQKFDDKEVEEFEEREFEDDSFSPYKPPSDNRQPEGWREHAWDGTLEPDGSYRVDIKDYVGDLGSTVNVEQLQSLGMLPKFMDDVASTIRANIEDMMSWRMGYTKKLDECLGVYDSGYAAPNLIILDVSSSIPNGIVATMTGLIDTLREQANAELIVTSARSYYWGLDDELPDPQAIIDKVGRNNESEMFWRIIRDRIAGRHFGTVISFGDDDSPYYAWGYNADNADLKEQVSDRSIATGTRVDRVMHFHVPRRRSWQGNGRETGYARWVKEICPDVEEVFDESWAEVIYR